MAKEKRTKPCSNCKQLKVKCEYSADLPCKRCIFQGVESSCHFIAKLPSIRFSLIANNNFLPSPAFPQIEGLPRALNGDIRLPTSSLPIQTSILPPSILPNQGLPPPVNQPPKHEILTKTIAQESPPVIHSDKLWKSSMESKLNSFDTKFNDLFDALRQNQEALSQEREISKRYAFQNEVLLRNSLQTQSEPASRGQTPEVEAYAKRVLEDDLSQRKKQKPVSFLRESTDFRDTVLTIDEARELFQFFDNNISQQLFGFEIKRFSMDVIWETSPILVCAICTIAAMHYPAVKIASKQEELQLHLQRLCAELLFKGKPKTEAEGFNAIVALTLCSFWLSDSQRFTGLALQLAKEFGFNRRRPAQKAESLTEKDRLKLWYLLYVLDGQQSMSLNRDSLFSADDFLVSHSRDLLLPAKSKQITAAPNDKKVVEKTPAEPLPPSAVLTDLRLVSQVEYNQALSEAFKGNAWELLAPLALGIPSKSNLELDKWMVSWTVLLAPISNGAVWLSKSTLIYYNFAKMHINSGVIRRLQIDTGDRAVVFPNWDKYRQVADEETVQTAPQQEDSSDDEDDFIKNTELSAADVPMLHLDIAVNAARTVLNLVLNDTDILNNLKYVPVHIHIMLYYAAMLLVSPPSETQDVAFFSSVMASLGVVKALHRRMLANLPVDKSFGHQLLSSLEDVISERSRSLKNEINAADLDSSVKTDLLNQLSQILSSLQIETLPDSPISSGEASPKPEKISAWPGSHHGHP